MLETHQIEIKSNWLRGKKVISTLSYLNSRSLESQMISSAHIDKEQCPLALCNQYGKGMQSKVQVIIFEPSRRGVPFLSQSSVGMGYYG